MLSFFLGDASDDILQAFRLQYSTKHTDFNWFLKNPFLALPTLKRTTNLNFWSY